MSVREGGGGADGIASCTMSIREGGDGGAGVGFRRWRIAFGLN